MTVLRTALFAVTCLALVAVQPWNASADEVRLDTDLPGAASSQEALPCAVGGDVYVIWEDARNGALDIYFNRSADGGATWLLDDVRLDTDAPGAAASRNPRISCDGGHVFVVWSEERAGKQTYFNHSNDGGATWGADAPVGAIPATANTGTPDVANAGESIYVVWYDDRNLVSPTSGSIDIFFNRSLNGGQTWMPTDIRLDRKTTSMSFSTEPRLRLDGDNLYVVWMDSRSSSIGYLDIFFNRSTNLGGSWLASDLRLDTDSPGASASYFPEIESDGENVYVVWTDERQIPGYADVYLNRSTDGGSSWLPADVRVDTKPFLGQGSFEPGLCVGDAYLYAVWNDRRDSFEPEVRFSRSSDGGASWLGSDVRLDTPFLGAGASGSPQIVCDGTDVAVVWQDTRNGEPDIYLNTSADAGDTWRRDSTRLGSDEPGAGRSVIPSFIREGDSTYLTWQDDRDGSCDIYFLEPDLTPPPLTEYRLDTDPPGSATSGLHQVCADGSNVGVVWQDNRFVSPSIYYRGSTNAGVNWSGWDIRLDTGGVGGSKWLPQICCGNGNVYAVWMALGQESADVYFNRSTDGGETWLADEMRIGSDAPGSGIAFGPQIACEGDDVYLVWSDDRNGATDIYFNRSVDAGSSWLPADVRLDTDVPGAAVSGFPEIGVVGSNVAVAWEDERSGLTDIHFNRSTDGGTNWQSADVRLDTDAAGSGESGTPRISTSGDNVYVVWRDERNGQLDNDIYLNRSVDNGVSWLASDVRLDSGPAGAANSSLQQICSNGDDVYVVWEDERIDILGPHIRMNRSSDAGLSWLPEDQRIDRAYFGDAKVPKISCEDQTVDVVWQQRQDAAYDVYWSTSRDAGVTWSWWPERLDKDEPGAADSFGPEVTREAGRMYVVWGDERNGNADIYFDLRSGPCPVTSLAASMQEGEGLLDVLYAFRDQLKLRGAEGLAYVEAYYAHALEGSAILAMNADLRTQARSLLAEARPLLARWARGETVTPSRQQLDRVDLLLASLETKSGEGLRAAARKLRVDLRRGNLFGVTFDPSRLAQLSDEAAPRRVFASASSVVTGAAQDRMSIVERR